MPLHAVTVLLALLVSPAALAGLPEEPTGAPCPQLPNHPGLACASTSQGWFYAGDADTAADIAADAAQAAGDFERYFGRPAQRGAVVAAGSSAVPDATTFDMLRQAGARWALPWLDEQERREVQRSVVERTLREQMPEADDARIAAMLEQALPSAPPASGDSTDRSALRHEIGHMLLIRAFWPDNGEDDGGERPFQYGGPGPDWLDEAAAVLMEGPAMAARRLDMLASDEAGTHLQPLPDFLAAAHPMLEQLDAARAGSTGNGPSITIASGEEAQRMADGAQWFYTQARAFAGFLIETSDRPGVLGEVAAHIAAGGDMEGWLAGHGAAHGLPESLPALDLAWKEWLAGRH